MSSTVTPRCVSFPVEIEDQPSSVSSCQEKTTCNNFLISFICLFVYLAVVYQERESSLKIHYEDGFSLSITSEDQQSVVLWKYSFSQLKKSSDDGSKLLWLTFDDGDTKVSDFYKHDDMIWVYLGT